MVRNIALLISLLFFFACSDEYGLENGPDASTGTDAVAVSFTLSLKIKNNTEYVPMVRAGNDTVLTQLTGPHRYVLLKKVNDGWYIDKIDSWQIGASVWSSVDITASTSLPPLKLLLRPATYRLAVFLNGGTLAWDKTFKEGSYVTGAATADKDFPCLMRYATQQQHYKKSIILSREPFSGYVEFTVDKNDDLHTEAPVRSFEVPLTRKAAQFQILMRRTPEVDGSFFDTPYGLLAVLRAPADNPFCEGLNVLGLAYFDKASPCTELEYCCSTTGVSGGVSNWRTDSAGRQYQMAEQGSSVPSPFLLADPDNPAGVPMEVCDMKIYGQTGNDRYVVEQNITKILKANQVCGIAFESTGRRDAQEYLIVYARPITDEKGDPVDESEFLLPPYYLWNPSLFMGSIKQQGE